MHAQTICRKKETTKEEKEPDFAKPLSKPRVCFQQSASAPGSNPKDKSQTPAHVLRDQIEKDIFLSIGTIFVSLYSIELRLKSWFAVQLQLWGPSEEKAPSLCHFLPDVGGKAAMLAVASHLQSRVVLKWQTMEPETQNVMPTSNPLPTNMDK